MIMGFVGIVAALIIGAGCRALDIPSPSPPKPEGRVARGRDDAGLLARENST